MSRLGAKPLTLASVTICFYVLLKPDVIELWDDKGNFVVDNVTEFLMVVKVLFVPAARDGSSSGGSLIQSSLKWAGRVNAGVRPSGSFD